LFKDLQKLVQYLITSLNSSR